MMRRHANVCVSEWWLGVDNVARKAYNALRGERIGLQWVAKAALSICQKHGACRGIEASSYRNVTIMPLSRFSWACNFLAKQTSPHLVSL